jgi:hypothetical protein
LNISLLLAVVVVVVITLEEGAVLAGLEPELVLR